MTNIQKKRLLITGASGLLGSNLAYCLRDDYEIYGLYHTHAIEMDKVSARKCDLRIKSEIEKIIHDLSPDIVIHCAAQTNVDSCEDQPDQAEQLNVRVVRNIVESLSGGSSKLIHISTDMVYDGINGNFSEDDPTGPMNVYARSKVDGEKEALKAQGALVLRTNFFGWNIYEKESLGEWVINSLSSHKEIKGFTDARFSSIYTFDLAGLMDKAIRENLFGIYNLGSGSSLSKYDFAMAIADELNFNTGLIVPTSIDNFNFKAKRSRDLSLNISKLEEDTAISGVLIEKSIERFTRDFENGIPGKFKSFAKQRVRNEG